MGGGPAIGGIGLVVIVLIGLFLGVDVTPLLNQGGVPIGGSGGEVTAADEEAGQFVSVTLADTEDVWTAIFANQLGRQYRPPTLVLFKGVTQSPCGGASGATGPFYCPLDQKAYLDTDFFTTLERQLGANGDFAAAYVVAHEIGHHVQNELGILGRTNEIRRQVSPAEANAISVRVELQADCFAGLWARAADEQLGTVEPGDHRGGDGGGPSDRRRHAAAERRTGAAAAHLHARDERAADALVLPGLQHRRPLGLRHLCGPNAVRRRVSLWPSDVTRAREEPGPSGGTVDAGDSKSPAARLVGSSPTSGTTLIFLRFLAFCRPFL